MRSRSSSSACEAKRGGLGSGKSESRKNSHWDDERGNLETFSLSKSSLHLSSQNTFHFSLTNTPNINLSNNPPQERRTTIQNALLTHLHIPPPPLGLYQPSSTRIPPINPQPLHPHSRPLRQPHPPLIHQRQRRKLLDRQKHRQLLPPRGSCRLSSGHIHRTTSR